MSHHPKVYMVGGGKGGVGKSTVSFAMLDVLLTAGVDTLLVESDDSNPDVYKAHKDLLPCEICNLDSEAGYIKLGEIAETHPDKAIVVNTAARATQALIEHGQILHDTCKALGRPVVLLWPINRQRDSLELLKKVVDSQADYEAIYVILNTYFGKPEKFQRYHTSKLKEQVTDTIILPELDDMITDYIVDNRLTLGNANADMTVAKRSALYLYREQIHKVLKAITGA